MKTMPRTLIFVFLVFLGTNFTTSYSGKWLIDSQSKLTIHGTTNVNGFTCLIEYYTNADTLEFTQRIAEGQIVFSKSKMQIPVKHFDCGNRQISKDFWETLKAKEYPNLTINFKSLNNASIRDNTYIDGVVDITLAGQTKRFTIRYLAKTPDKNTVLLKGVRNVNFSDFKLRAPQKLMGLIQVQEALTVEFLLTLKTV